MSKESKGVFWSAVDHFSVQGVQFVLSIVIARLVAPESYGIIAMIQVFLAMAQWFVDGGFKEALVQKIDRKDVDYSTVFIFNLAVAVLLYVLMFFAAPYIAVFFKEPSLTRLTRVISLNLIFSSLSITQIVRLTVNLDFKLLAKSRVISTLLSGVIGVVCAYKGMEVWALVIQNVLAALFSSILLIYFAKWIPKLDFSRQSFKELFPFGSKILFTYIITEAYLQLTNLFIGKVYTKSDLAFYNRGFGWSYIIPGAIVNIIGRIAFPVLCENQKDTEKLSSQYRKYIRLETLLVFPLMAILAILSKQIVVILLTDKWFGAAIYLSVFCMVYITQPLLDLSRKLMLSIGRADVTAKVTFYTRFMTFGIMLATIHISPLAVAIGSIINNMVESVISFICVKNTAQISIRQQLSNFIDIVLATLVSGGITYLFSTLFSNIYLSLIAGLIGGSIAMITCIFIMKMDERKYINLMINRIIK